MYTPTWCVSRLLVSVIAQTGQTLYRLVTAALASVDTPSPDAVTRQVPSLSPTILSLSNTCLLYAAQMPPIVARYQCRWRFTARLFNVK